MKKLLTLIFLITSASVNAQNYSFVNGDTKFMVPNKAKNAESPNLDDYILKPDLPDGSYTIFYDAAKTKVFQKGFLLSGHRVKSWAYYTEDQKPKMTMEYDESGLIAGVVREYYPSGALKTETQFRNGQANGLMVSYYETGIKKMQVGMKNNNMDGKAVFYDSTGKVTQSMDMKYGESTNKK